MTTRECAVIEAFTGVCMLCDEDTKYFYEYVAELFGRPVFTHELPALAYEIKSRSLDDFLKLCRDRSDDVVPVVRCKDCRHRSEDDDGLFWCIGRGSPAHLVEPDGFCDRGRRK